MPEQIITNKDRLKFYNEAEYHFNWDKEPKAKKWVYKFFYPLSILVCNYKFDLEYYGADNVPQNGPLIIAANHVAGLDPIILTHVLEREGAMRTMYFMAKEEFFHVFYTKYPLLFFGGFPVKRGTADRDSLNYAIKILNNNFILLVFPEGTRNKERTRPGDAKGGVALLAREAKADVLPVSIYRSKTVKGKKDKYVMRIGEVIPFEDLGLGEKANSKELKAATKKIMDSIGELWDIDSQK